jgi:protein-L-isoaspartate(D-aspartate) O-methyltransferase
MDNKQGPADFPWANDWPEITDERVRTAFARTPRNAFVEAGLAPWAGIDAPLPIGEGQTISQPFVVALMTQALRLEVGDRVLEVGTGSGFQTAILCELVDGDPKGCSVTSVERFPSLVERAEARLTALGYQPVLHNGDGAYGWPDSAPYDAIIVTAAAPFVPKLLWGQLAVEGRLVIPVGEQHGEQILWLVEKTAPGMRRRSYGPVRFVPLVSPLFGDQRQKMFREAKW